MLRKTHLALALALGAGVATVGAATPVPGPSDSATSPTSSPSAPATEPSPTPTGSATEPSPGPFGPQARAVIKDVNGKTVGLLRILGGNSDRARIMVAVRDLPPGQHGFHIHSQGVCDPTATDPKTKSPFQSAGPHFDLDSHSHPSHSGDLPDLMVGEDGTGRASVMTDRFQVQQLFDQDGSAIIVHTLPDNHANIPDRYKNEQGEPGPDAETLKTGDSGGRIACGVITRR